MHILILAPTSSAAQQVQATIGDTAKRYSITHDLPEALSCLEESRPDLIIVLRSALAQAESETLLDLTRPGQPPLVLVDGPSDGIREGIKAAVRLQVAAPVIRIGELSIDTRKKRAGIGGRWVTLPPLQYRLLLTLANRSGEVISFRELLQAVWGYDGEDSEARELLKVHIRQIRRRLGLSPEQRHYIRSVRGFGYMLTPPDED